MKYIDVHSHLQFVAYDDDREEAYRRAREEGVALITVGTQKDTSIQAVTFAREHEGVYATVGLHPIHTSKSFHDTQELGPSFAKASAGKGTEEGFTSRGERFDSAVYREMAKDPKVVAIGECGLDYYRLTEETKALQVEALEAQIALSREVGKPLMLHIRNAYEDALDVLKAYPDARGNVHFFAGNWDMASRFLERGFTLSFTGVITFTHDYDEVVRNIPLSMILTETDAPYITPVPHRGKRNEPLHVREVVKKIAEIRGIAQEEVREATVANAMRVFGLVV